MGVADGSSLATISASPLDARKPYFSISPMSFIREPRVGFACGRISRSIGMLSSGRADCPRASSRRPFCRPATADLHYRGYSSINRGPSGRVEIPDYAHLVGTKQRWRDLIGYYTRYGDVRELLAQVDDRYVIMNSGDEMTLKFPEFASATDRLAARLRHRRRRMDQGWGLQFDFFQNRAAIASSQRARLRDPAGKARGRVDVSATPGGLGEIPHPLRYSGGFQ